MNGDNIFDTKTGETYEEHALRMRDERIALLEAERVKLIEVLKSARQVRNRNELPDWESFDEAIEACSDVSLE